jgi:hypothetical protein
MVERGVTHVGVATDHVVESFRNDLYQGYKTVGGIPPDLYSQFSILEEALRAAGFVVWPMIEFAADDAMAAAAVKAARDERADRVVICKSTVVLVNQDDTGQTLELHENVLKTALPELVGHLSGGTLSSKTKHFGSYTLRTEKGTSNGKWVIFQPVAQDSRLEITFTPHQSTEKGWSSPLFWGKISFHDGNGAVWGVRQP